MIQDLVVYGVSLGMSCSTVVKKCYHNTALLYTLRRKKQC